MSNDNFRADVEGLRALAIVAVLLFHADLPVPGGFVGVDVFFVLSGYLITQLLLREVEKTGSISLLDFYARRARRLLPASCLVLLVTLGLTMAFGPEADRSVLLGDAVWASAYAINWRLALRSVDYMAEDVVRTPFLHYWSLSVEEQFYLLWPLLLVTAAAVAARFRTSWRLATALALFLVLVPSLTLSVLAPATRHDAFFATTTRLWELGIGALTALAASRMRALGGPTRTWMGWLGLSAILGSIAFANGELKWPGSLALLPTLGTALVLASGEGNESSPLRRLLGAPPFVFLGGISYSLYLWHWPAIVLVHDWLELEGLKWNLIAVGGSVVPAWLSTKYLERPLRNSKTLSSNPSLSISLGLNLSLLGVLAGFAAMVPRERPIASRVGYVKLLVEDGRVTATPRRLGAGALIHDRNATLKAERENDPAELFPPAESVRDDVAQAHLDGCEAGTDSTKLSICAYGDINSPRRAVAVGDSKLSQFGDALDIVMKAEGIRLELYTKSACPFVDGTTFHGTKVDEDCAQANRERFRHLLDNPPEFVIVSQGPDNRRRKMAQGREDHMVRGAVSYWSTLREKGSEVIVILDSPGVPKKKPLVDCVLKHRHRLGKCFFDREAGVKNSAIDEQVAAAKSVPGVHVVDLTDLFCPGKTCPAVIGGVIVYRDLAHITNTYARSLAPELQKRLKPLVKRRH